MGEWKRGGKRKDSKRKSFRQRCGEHRRARQVVKPGGMFICSPQSIAVRIRVSEETTLLTGPFACHVSSFGNRPHLMKTSILLSAAAICLAPVSLSTAQEAKRAEENSAKTGQEALEAEFITALTNATMSGRWTGIKEGTLTPEKTDTYDIISVAKVSGDNWLINARIRYGKLDLVAPVPVQVTWAGDTAVIGLTDMAIPGIGTYSARVLVYKGTYAGTWSGGGHGGLMSGLIAPTKK